MCIARLQASLDESVLLGSRHIALVSAAVRLGETPKIKKPPDANRRVSDGGDDGVDKRRVFETGSKTFLEVLGVMTLFDLMRRKSGLVVSQRLA